MFSVSVFQCFKPDSGLAARRSEAKTDPARTPFKLRPSEPPAKSVVHLPQSGDQLVQWFQCLTPIFAHPLPLTKNQVEQSETQPTRNPRSDVVQITRQSATKQWWDSAYFGFDLYTAQETLDDASRVDP